MINKYRDRTKNRDEIYLQFIVSYQISRNPSVIKVGEPNRNITGR